MAEGARLESVYTFTGIVGSNPTLSASCVHLRRPMIQVSSISTSPRSGGQLGNSVSENPPEIFLQTR